MIATAIPLVWGLVLYSSLLISGASGSVSADRPVQLVAWSPRQEKATLELQRYFYSTTRMLCPVTTVQAVHDQQIHFSFQQLRDELRQGTSAILVAEAKDLKGNEVAQLCGRSTNSTELAAALENLASKPDSVFDAHFIRCFQCGSEGQVR